MKIKIGALVFKPMLGLTIVTLISFAILFSLGTWQYKRLAWKTNLLVDVEQAANAEPLTSLAQVNEILKSGKPLDFRRIELDGTFIVPTINDGKAFHLMRSDGKRYYWRLYQPYRDGNTLSYVATREFADKMKATPPAEITGQKKVIGYVRMVQSANRFTPKSTPAQNRWFAFNGAPDAVNWGDAVAGESIQTLYFIDQSLGQLGGMDSAKNLPVKMPDIVNNHLDYMLTWYSFILILLVIYLLFHKRAGRLYKERDSG